MSSSLTTPPGVRRPLSEDIRTFAIGDILLLRNPSPPGWFNRTYQRAKRYGVWSKVRGNGFIPTHAALLIGNNDVVHSDKRAQATGERGATFPGQRTLRRRFLGHGVDYIALDQLLAGKDAADILLVRHPDLQADTDQTRRLLRRAFYYLDMPFNILIDFRSGNDQSTFCSQYIYRVFNDCKLKLPPKNHNQVLPIDFLIWAQREQWKTMNGRWVLDTMASVTRLTGGATMGPQLASSHRMNVDVINKSLDLLRSVRLFVEGAVHVTQGLPCFPPSVAFEANVPYVAKSIAEIVSSAERLAEASLIRDESPETLGPSHDSGTGWNSKPSNERIAEERKIHASMTEIHEYNLYSAQVVLDDLSAAAATAIDYLERDETTAPRSAENLPAAFALITFILDLLRVKKDGTQADLDKEFDAICSGLRDKVASMMRGVMDDVARGERLDEEKIPLVRLTPETLHRLKATHAYTVAYDYANVCHLASKFDSARICTRFFEQADHPIVLEVLQQLRVNCRAIIAKLLERP